MIIDIQNKNALDYLKQFDDESIDCFISDIPYKIIAGGVTIKERDDECSGVLKKRIQGSSKKEKINKDVSHWYDNKVNRKYISDGSSCSDKWLKNNPDDYIAAIRAGKMFKHNDIKFEEWLPDVYRILKKGTHCYLMVNSRNLSELQEKSEKVGFVFQNLLIWYKHNVTPNRYYMQGYECILMLSKRPARAINNMGSKNIILDIPNIIGKKIHPTEKPVELMEYLLLNSTNENDTVMDCFMGSCPTGVACKKHNRNFYGNDIDEYYYNLSKERVFNGTIEGKPEKQFRNPNENINQLRLF